MAGIGAGGTRRLLLFSGSAQAAAGWLGERLAAAPAALADDCLWLAAQAPEGFRGVTPGEVLRHLGGEYGLLVVDAAQGFHPDAFAAALGMLRGGGDCLVIAPPHPDWGGFSDPDQARFAAYPNTPEAMHGRFLARLQRLWRDDPAVCAVDAASDLLPRFAPPSARPVVLSAAQRAAVAAVQRVARGHARRPLVLTADRGRGKSTVLGCAAAGLLREGVRCIRVVAPHRAAARTLYRHALAAFERELHEVGDTELGGGWLRFCLPAECQAGVLADADLVLVDEAAAIPVALLGRLLGHCNRLVFASTVHGYEGSGRGFALRFQALLEQQMPQWQAWRLEEPVRWAAADPLERLLNRSLLLDVDLDSCRTAAALTVDAVDIDRLAEDETLLRAVFGLLVNAHYQTRPSDLRQLLDNPDVRLWLARSDGDVVGVLLATVEGGLDADMAAQVLAGRRRPRGHLLAQSLAVHAGLDEVLGLRGLRVQRIAVHPERRLRGGGRSLLATAQTWATDQGFDLLGCAYGVELPLLAFWTRVGLLPARLGVRRDPASAAHSLFMLRGLSVAGTRVATRAHEAFLADLPWALGSSLDDLEPALALRLLRGRDCADLQLSGLQRRGLQGIAAGVRQPATAPAAVWKAVVGLAAQGVTDSVSLQAMIARHVQHHPVHAVCSAFALEGARALDEALRALLAQHESALMSSG